ncbi:MAG: parallel beta-helix repeat protein, partial [Planctomycetota bacterium]
MFLSRTMLRFRLSYLCSGLLLLATLQMGSCQSSGSGSSGSEGAIQLAPQAGTALGVLGAAQLPAGEYLLPPVGSKGEQGVLRLVGLKDVTLDLSGASLRGTPAGTNQDQGMGWGLVLEDCENVTVRGGSFGGYRACVVLNNCTDVTLEGIQFESWYGARLYSTAAAEGSSDWLRPHENDLGEWTRNYGAAISANDCEGLVIRGCKGRHGQNGILLTRTNSCEIYDCDFSFLSGWGLALYRSNHNRISHNLFDYCVRGYSHGVYWRGQDSAGILMFERCSDNVIAYNSATHGGDGVFLFAGQDLVEGRALARGELEDPGGSDRNLFYGNDLRFSVANSLEATFSSDNVLVKNRLSGSHQHGVWGGYSKRMVIVDNEINDSLGGGITIEHGQDCFFGWNEISGNEMGVEVYWDPDPGLVRDSHFGKTRDSSSRDHWIIGNNFAGNDQDLVIRETRGVSLSGNLFSAGARPLLSEVTAEGRDQVQEETLLSWLAGRDGQLPSGNLALASLRPIGDQP